MNSILKIISALLLVISSTTAYANMIADSPYYQYQSELVDPRSNFKFSDQQIMLNSFDLQQIKCMAENTYHEARGEPQTGQIAVNYVVMNRVEDARFPSTPCDVIWQRNRRGCQFSWVCTGTNGIRNLTLYSNIENLSTQVYLNRSTDITNGALFYHASYVSPRWKYSMQQTARIGSHIFYIG